jgi:transcriptional regulator with XRE-family HTH domain
MNIIDRLQQVIEHEGLTVASFAKKIGVGDQTIRGIVIQKRNNPGYELIYKISQAFDWLNIEWLITGEGEMTKSSKEDNELTKNSTTEITSYLREKDQKIEQLIEEKAVLKFKYEQMKRDQIYNKIKHQ